jgi:hypothetical protein
VVEEAELNMSDGASHEIIDKEDQETKEKCLGLFPLCSKLQSSCVCSGEKEATARSTEEVEDADIECLTEGP